VEAFAEAAFMETEASKVAAAAASTVAVASTAAAAFMVAVAGEPAGTNA
jgi:hypothetical protein